MSESSFALALSKYIYDALNGESPTIAPVFDDVPQGTEPPFIEIGDASAVPSDTKTSNGETIDIEIVLIGAHRGRKAARELARQVSAQLHDVRNEAMSYGRIVHMFRAGYSDRRDDPSTPRYRGSLMIRAICSDA